MKSQFVESLRRLFHDGEVTVSKLKELQEKNTISKEDYLYITDDNDKKVG